MCAILIITSLYVVIGAPVEFAQIRIWRAKWYGEFLKWIDQLPRDRIQKLPFRIDDIKANPAWLPDSDWEGFKGERFPTHTPSFERWSELIVALVLGGMALFASSALMALIFRA